MGARPKKAKKAARKAAARKPEPAKPGVVARQRDVAEAFGVSTRTVEGWARRGMPTLEGGGYSIPEVARWKAERDERIRQARALGVSPDAVGAGAVTAPPLAAGDDDPMPADLVKRNLWLDAQLKRERLKAARQKAIPVPHVQQMLRDRAAALRKELLALSRRLAPRCEGRSQTEIREQLDRAFERLLEGYAADPEGGK